MRDTAIKIEEPERNMMKSGLILLALAFGLAFSIRLFHF
jgi:hypothetical protein